ncbi:hypothetical protein O181_016974 [Austropuccinia psidii MF-1]|uniref:Uncharacterized protein n=1 Tax=Austropuccinia psidii MF-1 TaxID=1389203 RepID=A0A9Q3C4X0_9BASI|nr:hypothetical protein [Austropuccinia psidii MF-1]
MIVLPTGSRKRSCKRDTNSRGSIPLCGRPIYSILEVPMSRIKIQGIVKRIRRISDLPTNPDGKEVEVLDKKIGQTNAPPEFFQTHILPSTPKNFYPRLSTCPSSIHQSSPHPSIARLPALASPMRPLSQGRF